MGIRDMGEHLMPVLLSLVTEDEILEDANGEKNSCPGNQLDERYPDAKARNSFKAAKKGRALLQRITEEKSND